MNEPEGPDVTIRMDSKDVGFLSSPCCQPRREGWDVWLHITDGESWHNRRYKHVNTEAEARQWVKDNWPQIVALGLHGIEL